MSSDRRFPSRISTRLIPQFRGQMIVLNRLSAFWTIATLVSSLRAQESGLFQWSFGSNEALTTSVPICFPISIVVYPMDASSNPVPPFYMISLALDDTPVTSFIGMDPNNLTWTVNQRVGSQLALSVVDAKGSLGGLAPQIFNVVAGQSSSCEIDAPPTTFTVFANVTSPANLTTCDPWGLTIQGGHPPYTVTLVQPNSPNFTNVTVPPGFKVLTYINRANPNGQLIAAVSDSTGAWASGTPVVNTIGSTDVSCGNLETSSGTSNGTSPGSSSPNGSPAKSPQQVPSNPAVNAQTKHRTVIIVVSIVSVVLALLIVGGATFYAWKRKRKGQAGTPQTWHRTTIDPKSPVNNDFNPASLYSPPLRGQAEQPYVYSRLAHNSNLSLPSLSGSAPTVALSYHQQQGNSWSRKAPDADLSNAVGSQKPSQGTSSINLPPNSGEPAAKKSTGPVIISRLHASGESSITTVTERPSVSVVNVDGGSEAVFQHRDAGPVGIEVPPPYLDYDPQP